jgi:hypothetical protein
MSAPTRQSDPLRRGRAPGVGAGKVPAPQWRRLAHSRARDGVRGCGTLAAALAACASLMAGNARAEAGGAPTARVPDLLLPTDGLNVDIGAGLAAHPRYLGSTVNVIDAVPVIEAQWGRDLHLSLDDGLTYVPWRIGPLALGGVVEFKQDYASPRLAHGLRNADTWEAGAVARLATPFGDIEGRVRRSLDGDVTNSADITFDTAVQSTARLALAFEARGAWANEAFTIPRRLSRAYPAPSVRSRTADYYAFGAEVAAIYKLDDAWRVTALASVDEIAGGDSDALRLSTRTVPEVSVVLTRRLKLF